MATIRNNKGRGGLFSWLIIGGLLLFYFLGQEESPQPPAASNPPTNGADLSRVAQPSSQESYALNALRNDWPDSKGAQPPLSDPQQLLASNYYLVLDDSGSMAERECADGGDKHRAAIAAVKQFARSLPPQVNFGLAVFNNSQLRELIPLGPQQPKALEVLDYLVPSGATPLFSALKFAYGKLSQQGERQQGYGEYHMVVVTDGLANEGQDPTPITRLMRLQSPVVLHTIGFCIGEYHSLNQPGSSYYQSANDPGSLQQGLDNVLAESPAFNVDRFQP